MKALSSKCQKMSKNIKCMFIVVMHLATPSWREADQLAIYKHDRGVELGSTKKQLHLSGQSGT